MSEWAEQAGDALSGPVSPVEGAGIGERLTYVWVSTPDFSASALSMFELPKDVALAVALVPGPRGMVGALAALRTALEVKAVDRFDGLSFRQAAQALSDWIDKSTDLEGELFGKGEDGIEK